MSNIVGYIGKKLGRSVLLKALQKLKYRDYNCAGFACIQPENNCILYVKVTDKLSKLLQQCRKMSKAAQHDNDIRNYAHIFLASGGQIQSNALRVYMERLAQR